MSFDERATFPGGTSTSWLSVYSWEAPDGACGGSPHLHTATVEGYVVIAGRGRVQTLSKDDFQEHELRPGVVLWFSPGTVHRLVNDDGELDIITVMGNSGLPEAGDAVLTFPADVLADPDAYQAAVAVPEGTREEQEAAVRQRRDLALQGFAELREQVDREGPAALAALYTSAARLVQTKVPHWRQLVEDGPLAQVNRTLDALAHLERGDGSVLEQARVSTADPLPDGPSFGMCGYLQKWDFSHPRTSGPAVGEGEQQ